MDDNTKLILLYDYYGELLTEKQKNYFEDYYFSNMTLSEISENNNVSRSAVQKQLKIIENKLNYYENTLLILNKKEKILKLLSSLDNIVLKNKIEDIL